LESTNRNYLVQPRLSDMELLRVFDQQSIGIIGNYEECGTPDKIIEP